MTISSRSIRKIYQSLDKDQVQLVIDKKIEGTMDILDWLEKLRKLAVMDSMGDDSRKKAGELTMIFGLITVFTLILTVTRPFLFFFPLAFFLLFVYFLIMFLTLRKIDIGNNLRNFIVPVLEHYSEPERTEGQVYLKMDFSNPKDLEFEVVEDEGPEKRNRVFRHPWMTGQMMFNDHILIRWEVEDLVTESGRRLQDKARNIDLKVKNKVTHRLSLVFRVPKSSFDVQKENIEPAESGNHYKFTLERTDHSDSLEEGMDPKIFIDAIDYAYRNIRVKKSTI